MQSSRPGRLGSQVFPTRYRKVHPGGLLPSAAYNPQSICISEPHRPGDRAGSALGIRLRKFYATKHTYVSLALTRGVNLAWLSEQTGVAATTLLKHYGKFIHTLDADRVELLKIEGRGGPGLPTVCPRGRGANRNPRNRSWVEASPTGFEPVLPA
jgi:hypothetical protein